MGAVEPEGEPADRIGTSPAAPGEVVLVRHGQGECNAAGVIGGRVGCRGLSPRGRWESARLARRLAELDAARPFDVLLSTPRLRVLQCSQIIGARLARPVVVVDALRGQEFGAADGQSWEDVIRGFGGPPTHEPDRPIAKGAESWNAYADRVLAALAAVLAEHAGRRVLLVGHGKTTGLAGALLSGASDPRSCATDFVVDHGALSHWRREADHWSLVIHNDSRHLAV
jgi:2,3-bisphosphoglycerate-dependent phosphoglycerate mutase